MIISQIDRQLHCMRKMFKCICTCMQAGTYILHTRKSSCSVMIMILYLSIYFSRMCLF